MKQCECMEVEYMEVEYMEVRQSAGSMEGKDMRGSDMKVKFNNKYFRWGLTAFLVLAAAIGFYYLVFHGANIKKGFSVTVDILMPVVVGAGLAYLLTPVLNFIEIKILYPLCNLCKIKETRKRNSVLRGISTMVTLFLFVEMIYLLFHMLISQIVPSVQNIINNYDTYTDNFIKWLNKIMEDNPEMGKLVTTTIDKYSAEIEKWADGILPNTFQVVRTVSMSVLGFLGFLWDFIIGLIISIYVLASKEKFSGQAKKLVYAMFEQDTANTIVKNFRFTHRTFIGFLSGKILDSFIIGVLCFVGTSLMKTPYAALVSVIIGFTNIIPFFGPFLGAVPSALLIFIVNPMQPLNCVYFVLFILVLQQVDGNIIGPKILSSSTGLAGFWVIFAITLFGGLFGVVGMIVGVPIFAVIYASIRSAVNTSLQKKNLPTETKKYVNLAYMDEEGIHEISRTEEKSALRKQRKEHEKADDLSDADTEDVKTDEVSDTESE